MKRPYVSRRRTSSGTAASPGRRRRSTAVSVDVGVLDRRDVLVDQRPLARIGGLGDPSSWTPAASSRARAAGRCSPRSWSCPHRRHLGRRGRARHAGSRPRVAAGRSCMAATAPAAGALGARTAAGSPRSAPSSASGNGCNHDTSPRNRGCVSRRSTAEPDGSGLRFGSRERSGRHSSQFGRATRSDARRSSYRS
jgi:hypothetical protein